MTPRERNMAIGFLAAILLGGGAFGGYTFVYEPLSETNAAIKQLLDEVEGDGSPEKPGLKQRVEAMKNAAPQLLVAKRQSLPQNIDLAKDQYKLLLVRLFQQAKIGNYTLPDTREIQGRPPVTPELAPKKPAYTRLAFRVEIHKVDIWQLADFLNEFYQLDLLHQITDITITRQNKPTEMRNGLDVHLVIEAIILDGAETKLSMFPVILAGKLTSSGEAVAAIGGGGAVEAVASQPELGRRVTALSNTPVLAARHRDYSLLALQDMFYGVLPKAPTERDPSPPKKDDIASAIKLIIVSESSEGTSTAIVQDTASPFKYKITVNPKKRIEVVKFYLKLLKSRVWQRDLDYEYPEGVLAFSDETSSTKRSFKVLAIEDNSLIVADLAKSDAKLDLKAATLYRWGNGKSLKDLDRAKIPADETRKILQRIAQDDLAQLPVLTAK